MFSLTWSPGITLDQLERHAIEQAFRFYQGNKTQTARALDIAIRTLEVKLEKYAFDDERAKEAFETGRLQREEFQRRQRGIASPAAPTHAAIHNSNGSGSAQPAQAERHGYDSHAGVRVEPAAHVSPKQSVPVQERQEVQGVLPAKAPTSGVRKTR